jgi:hypothetical protein
MLRRTAAIPDRAQKSAGKPWRRSASADREVTKQQLSGGSPMNALVIRSWFARRSVVWILTCGAASLLVATLTAASPRETDKDRGGAEPYAPTRGEWLCLFLNSRQALFNSERVPRGVDVHYLYDLSKPDTIRIELLFSDGVGQSQLQHCAARAEDHVTETAKVHGWQNWLKIETAERKVTDLYVSNRLIR